MIFNGFSVTLVLTTNIESELNCLVSSKVAVCATNHAEAETRHFFALST